MAHPANGRLTSITLRHHGREIVVKIGEIMYLEGQEGGTKIHTASRTLRLPTNLQDLESWLSSRGFARIQRSTLVNVAWIAQVATWYDGSRRAVLRDAAETQLRIEPEYLDRIRAAKHSN